MMKAFSSLSDITGQPMPSSQIIGVIRQYKWSATFLKLAQIASAITADDDIMGSYVKSKSTEALANFQSYDPNRILRQVDIEQRVSEYFRNNPNGIIFHEQLIYFMQALCILEGAEEGSEPPDGLLAFYSLAANDHVHSWKHKEDESRFSRQEYLVAELALSTRFNRTNDPLRDFIRMYLILQERPKKSMLMQRWNDVQIEAFGIPFDEYFQVAIGPAILMVAAWGAIKENGLRQSPVVKPQDWLSKTRLSQEEIVHALKFLRRLTSTRSEAITELSSSRRDDLLPHAPTLFYRKPFVEIEDGVIVGATPEAARQQVNIGIWASFLKATQEIFKKDTLLWFRTFGQMLELWARRVAEEAEKGDSFRGRLLLSKDVGSHDEIEDIIIREGRHIALFSVKASLIRETSIKRAIARSEALGWYEDFFFEQKRDSSGPIQKDTRGGAFRLLNAHIDRIRNGEFKDIPANLKIFPVVVTFDDLGDNEEFYRWVRQRCKEEHLLRQHRVVSPSIINIAEFEMLMNLAYHGVSVFTVLAQRDDARTWGLQSKELLLNHYRDLPDSRLPFLSQQFQQISQRIHDRLFRRTEGASS